MKIVVPKEVTAGERRCAATPHTVAAYVTRGFEVAVEAGAGTRAGFSDDVFAEAGATVVPSAGWQTLLASADIVLKVEPLCERAAADGVAASHEADHVRAGATTLSFVFPKREPALLTRLAERGVSAVAIDAIPRITRAQKLDALSSMANIAGYRAVVEAANRYSSFFSGQFTAAGKVKPATVLVIGAGVAGLAAIAAAHGLGAIVLAFDTREAVRDEVKSLGAKFLELEFEETGEGQGGYARVMSQAFIDAEMALFRAHAPDVDIVITTALVPGATAPTLWTTDMVEAMKPGSVVVDLAAAQGGNCELSQPDQVIEHAGVSIIGYTDLTSRMARTASRLYANNLLNLVDEMLAEPGDATTFAVDMDDEVVRAALVTHAGEVTWPPPAPPEPTPIAPQAPPVSAPPASTTKPPAKAPVKGPGWITAAIGLALVALWVYLRATVDPESDDAATRAFVQHLTVFVLACFVGWQVIWSVTAALHTPLMSVTNAISGIIIVGGILEGGHGSELTASVILGLLATFLATLNIAGGFLVTQRMLNMFRKR